MEREQVTDQLDTPLRRDRLYEQVADRILDLILADSVSPGDRLPSERELAIRLDVSRPVVREAVRVLGVQGLVSVRPGSGTFIRKLTTRDASSPIGLMLRLRGEQDSFDDLHEVRQALEIQIAALAAERASSEDIEALRRAIDGMAHAGKSSDAFIEHDLAFHEGLARAAHNELFLLLLAPITDLLHDFRVVAYHHDPTEALDGGLRYHRLILECVERHDVDGARTAMREHLEQARSIFTLHRQQAAKSHRSAGRRASAGPTATPRPRATDRRRTAGS